MQQLHAFLHLKCCDYRTHGRGRWDLTQRQISQGHSPARGRLSNQGLLDLGQIALIARTLSGNEDCNLAQEILHRTIHPCLLHLGTYTVHRTPSQPAVQAGEDHVHSPYHTESQYSVQVTVDSDDLNIGIQLAQALGEYDGLSAPVIRIAKEHRSTQICRFHCVSVQNDHQLYAHHGQVLADFVSQGTRTYDENASFTNSCQLPHRTDS